MKFYLQFHEELSERIIIKFYADYLNVMSFYPIQVRHYINNDDAGAIVNVGLD